MSKVKNISIQKRKTDILVGFFVLWYNKYIFIKYTLSSN